MPVSVGLGVTGVAQFKQGIAQAQASMKTLDQELKLNEAQFKASGDAQTYMAQKAELLEKQLKAQQDAANNAKQALEAMRKSGVDQSSTAYQKMAQQLAAAQTGVLNMENQIKNLGNEEDEAADKAEDMANSLKSIDRGVSFQNVISGVDNITKKVEAAAKKLWQLGKGAVQEMVGSSEWADALLTDASKYGIDVETLQRMQKTADLIDTPVETIIKARQKLENVMRYPTKDTDQIFAQFGITTTRYGEAVDWVDVFWDAGKALQNMKNETERDAYANKLFGKSWMELNPLFEAGREQYEETMNSRSVVSEEQVKKLGDLNDQIMEFKQEMETMKMTILSEFAEPMKQVAGALTDMFKKVNEYLQTEEGKEKLKSLGDAATKLFDGLKNVNTDGVVDTFKSALEAITGSLTWIKDNGESIKTALLLVASGFGAIKIATIGLKIGEIVSGLRGLGFGGGGGNSTPTTPTVGADPKGNPAGGGKSLIPTVVSNVMNKTAGNVLTVGTAAGMLIPVVGDRLLNETEGGRALRDNQGFEAVIEGARQDVIKAADEFVKNLHTFNDDWARLFNTAWNETFGVEGGGGGSHGFGVDENTGGGFERSFGSEEDWQEAGRNAAINAQNGIDAQAPVLEEDAEIIGENTALGLANGIDAKASEAIKAAEAMASAVAGIIAGALKIQSPSKVMEQMGRYVSEGFAIGISDGSRNIAAAAQNMAGMAFAGAVRGSGNGSTAGSGMIHVTLMVDRDKLAEITAPAVNEVLGAELDTLRR